MSEYVNCNTCSTDCLRAGGRFGYAHCDQYTKKTMTNADHIREMSDEELAKIFMTTPSCVGEECSEDGDCTKCMLDWLRQPWEGNNDA